MLLAHRSGTVNLKAYGLEVGDPSATIGIA